MALRTELVLTFQKTMTFAAEAFLDRGFRACISSFRVVRLRGHGVTSCQHKKCASAPNTSQCRISFTNTSPGSLKMLVQDGQREVRTVFVGGFWGQLVSSKEMQGRLLNAAAVA